MPGGALINKAIHIRSLSGGNNSSVRAVPGNIRGEVTIDELLANDQLIPGMNGAYLKSQDLGNGFKGIRFSDISQLTINRNGNEFMLTRETISDVVNKIYNTRYRIYSGPPDGGFPPAFLRFGPNGMQTVERVIGHTHPYPVPYFQNWNHPSAADILSLNGIIVPWQNVYGQQSVPYGYIFGLPGDAAIMYGPRSTPGNAVFP